MWYLDCYCYAATCGSEFPVNSYSCDDPLVLTDVAGKLLARKTSGIDEVRISETTRGQSPTAVDRSQYLRGLTCQS